MSAMGRDMTNLEQLTGVMACPISQFDDKSPTYLLAMVSRGRQRDQTESRAYPEAARGQRRR